MHYVVVTVLSIEKNLGNTMWRPRVFGFSTNVFLNSRGDLKLSIFPCGKQNVLFLVKLSTYFDWISKYVVN